MNKGTLIGSRLKKLSLAVNIVDSQTKQIIDIRKCTVIVDNVSTKPIINRAGYFLFMDLAEDTYSITARASGYSSQNQQQDIKTLDQLFPVVTLELQPL